jgi:hypothetical protein
MSLFRSKTTDTTTDVSSTAFSDFIRDASAKKKKQVYSKVLKRASEAQRATISLKRKCTAE